MAADTRNGCVVNSPLPSQPSGTLTCDIYIRFNIRPDHHSIHSSVLSDSHVGFTAYKRAEYI